MGSPGGASRGRASAVEGGVVLVLAIETSTPQTSVALGTQQGVLASQLVSWGVGHSEAVAPAIDHLLSLTEVRPEQLAGIAVGLGPGAFTGLRVGIATARALAQVLRVPVVGYWFARRARVLGPLHAVQDSEPSATASEERCTTRSTAPFPPGSRGRASISSARPSGWPPTWEASGEETLLVGGGALLYRRVLEEAGTPLEFATATSTAFPGCGPAVGARAAEVRARGDIPGRGHHAPLREELGCGGCNWLSIRPSRLT